MGARTQAEGLAAAPGARQTGKGLQIAAFRAQGRLGQLSATTGLMQCSRGAVALALSSRRLADTAGSRMMRSM